MNTQESMENYLDNIGSTKISNNLEAAEPYGNPTTESSQLCLTLTFSVFK